MIITTPKGKLQNVVLNFVACVRQYAYQMYESSQHITPVAT